MTFFSRKQAGQAMTEYIIVVALVAISSIGVFLLYGWTVRPQMAALGMELSGQDGSDSQYEAVKSAWAMEEIGKEQKGLDNYMTRAVTAGL